MSSYLISLKKLFFLCFLAFFIFAVLNGDCAYSLALEAMDTHKVQQGETLWDISQKYNVSINSIIQANKLKNKKRLELNQVLIIPASGLKNEKTDKKAKLKDKSSEKGKKDKSAKNKKDKKAEIMAASIIYGSQPYDNASGLYHRVSNGQSLWDIAKMYKVPVRSIIENNKLASTKRLRPGSKIFVPISQKRLKRIQKFQYKRDNGINYYDDNTDDKADRVYYSAKDDPKDKFKSYVRQLVSLPKFTRKRRWQYILVHHSATESGNAKMFEYYHRYKRHMPNGLAYHFVINNANKNIDGKIEVGNRWKRQIQGGHVRSSFFNEVGIGICLVGNFEKYTPSSRQYRSLVTLIRVLQEQFGIPSKRVLGHHDIKEGQTLCPGKYVSITKLRSFLYR